MPINVRIDGGTVILSNIGRLMNDPKHVDAARDVAALLEKGHRRFVVELAGIHQIGGAGLGLLTTLTRSVRRSGGELALARPSRQVEAYLDEMRMDAFWDVFDSVEEAVEALDRKRGGWSGDGEPAEDDRMEVADEIDNSGVTD